MNLGRTLILIGAILVVAGLIVSFAGKLPFKLGRLPGDIIIRGRSSTFYFPLVTCLILSALGSLVHWLLNRGS